jgi:hypothetical protein
MNMLPAEISIHENHKRKLLKGQGILLKNEDLKGSNKVYLTKKQYNTLMKARLSGKGMVLKLTGSGFMDSVASLGKSAYDAIKPTLKKAVIEKTIDLAQSLGNSAIGSIGSGLASQGKQQNFRRGNPMLKQKGSYTVAIRGKGFKTPGE